jgi:hypothetical protein
MKTLRKWGAVGALAATAAFPVLAVNGTASAAPGGNSAAAHACQKGGYATLQGTDGTLFNNVGECVSFAAHGGTLEPIAPPSVSVTFTPTNRVPFCNVRVTISHFAPNTTYMNTFGTLLMPSNPSFSQTIDGTEFTTDASGNDTENIGGLLNRDLSIIYTVNGVNSPNTVIAC